jgi:hypothetical protein
LTMFDGACDSVRRFGDMFKPGNKTTNTTTPPTSTPSTPL